MEASLHHVKTHYTPLQKLKFKHSSIPSQLISPRHIHLWRRLDYKKVAMAAESNCGSEAECGSWGLASELEKELEAEMKNPEGDEWIGMGRWGDKCGGQGVVELLECLEREAIMGEDQGRDPTDYNRRAHIFDKSSRVFQALKERNAPTHQS